MRVPNPESAQEKKVSDLLPVLRLLQPAGDHVHHFAVIAKYLIKSAAEEKTLMTVQCGASSVAQNLMRQTIRILGARGKRSHSPHSNRSQKTYIEREAVRDKIRPPKACFH